MDRVGRGSHIALVAVAVAVVVIAGYVLYHHNSVPDAGQIPAVPNPATPSGSQPASRAGAIDNELALTPPMGWDGWNHYGRRVTASIVESQARALVSSGMKAAGYDYVNLDGGWNLLHRDAQGKLQPDPRKFPDGIAPLAAYVHSLGLKFGIYTSLGTTNCAHTSAGSWGHYQQDAQTFASWGIDFVKVGWCGVPTDQSSGKSAEQVAQKLFFQFGSALRSARRPMVYSLSMGQALAAWTWAPSFANMWPSAGNLVDSHAGTLSILASNQQHYQAASPGGWNDPGMLEVGNGAMTRSDSRTQVSLWAEMAAPMIASNDLTTMSSATRTTLINAGVIAVDQDPLGRQGYTVTHTNRYWVLTKPLKGGDRAVVLVNETNQSAVVSATARQVGLPSAAAYHIDDLWAHTAKETAGTISAGVAPHAVAMFRVTPSRR